jgi:hypothetical protein
MIEDVEHLAAELQIEPLRQLRILDDREVCVDKVWSRDRIAA